MESKSKIFFDAFFFPERMLKERKEQMDKEYKEFANRIKRIRQKQREENIEFYKQLLRILQMSDRAKKQNTRNYQWL